MSGVKVGAQGVTMRVDVALTMLDDMQKQLDTLTRAVHAMAEAMVVIEDAHKLTNAYPFANGSHDAEIAHYASEGWSDNDIAEELGASATTVSRRRAALGIEPNNPRRRWGRLDDDMLKAACEKYRTWAEVSRIRRDRDPTLLGLGLLVGLVVVGEIAAGLCVMSACREVARMVVAAVG